MMMSVSVPRELVSLRTDLALLGGLPAPTWGAPDHPGLTGRMALLSTRESRH